MSRRSPILTFGLPLTGLAALTAGSVMVMANAPHRPPELPPRQPPTAPTGAPNAAGFIGAIGITEPPGEAVQIAAHTAGIVEAVFVTAGDRVAIGAPLFRVDGRAADEEIAFRTSERDVRRAEVEALRGLIPGRRAEVAAAEAALLAAEANVRAATIAHADRANLVRIAQAVDDPRAIAAEEVDRRRFALDEADAARAKAEADRAGAAATLAASRAALGLLVDDAPRSEGADGAELRAAERRVARAEADLGRALVARELLTVRATVDGSVLQVNVRPGEFAPAKELSEGLVVLARSGPLEIRAQIDEVDIPRFRPSAKAWASPRGDTSKRLALTLVRVEPMVVPKRALSGRTSELVDTRVLEVLYAIEPNEPSIGVGQQMDLYIEAAPTIAEGGRS